MSRILIGVTVALFLSACQTHQPVPEGYAGPTATLSDSGIGVSGAKAQLFVAQEIDGNKIVDSFGASASASQGQGFRLYLQVISRKLPVRQLKVKLYGGVATGAPIYALFDQLTGSVQSVDGIVDFTPVAGAAYTVKGDLRDTGSSIWIEDDATHQPVTNKITAK